MYAIRTRTAEIAPFAAHFCDTSPSSNPAGTDFAADLTTIYLSRQYRHSAIRPRIAANRRLLKCGTGGFILRGAASPERYCEGAGSSIAR